MKIDDFLVVFIISIVVVLSSDINEKLLSRLNEITSFNELYKEYETALGSVKPSQLSESISVDLASTLSELFNQKLTSLKTTVKQVENLVENYIYNDTDMEDILWSTGLNKSLCELHTRGSYNNKICLKKSSVHIPIDIFKEEREIVESAAWTSMLDPIWITNKASSPQLLWQYFGSTSGLLRFYPGAEWEQRQRDKDNEKVDLYDVRRRSWFVQGMSLPKDVLILIDSSGSSQGQALALMKHITRSILETLNENDQINVLTFPQDSSDEKRNPCFSTFMRATFRNKEVAMDYTRKITSFGIANFSKGLELAFVLFENMTTNATESMFDSHCNQMIMLLTDGGNEKPSEVLRRFNSFKRIRIFTYLVGPISTHAPAIKWIAEKNRGHFYQIPSIVAIRSQTQDYIRYLSESKMDVEDPFTWTGASIDHLNNELVISITVPVFNNSHTLEGNNKTILGVLGIDVPIKEMFESHPLLENGLQEYFFIINSQGFVLYHPRFNNMDEKFLRVDILDIETHPAMHEIRENMIKGFPGSEKVSDYDDMLDEHHVNMRERTYIYRPITNTEFCLCVVLFSQHPHAIGKLSLPGSVRSEAFFNTGNTTVFFNDNAVCPAADEEEEEGGNMTYFEIFINRVSNFQCDEDDLKELIFDMNITFKTGESWVEKYNNSVDDDDDDTNDPGVILLFIKTSTMYRVFNKNNTLTTESFLDKYPSYEERISKTYQWIVTAYDETVENMTERIMLIARRIIKDDLPLAVVGVLINEKVLQSIVFGDVIEPGNETYTMSYLLDDGAIVISTNLDNPYNLDYVKMFFGLDSIEGEVMKDMLDKNIYKRHLSSGYLASCEDMESNAASSKLHFVMPLIELLSPRWWLSAVSFHLTWVTSTFHLILSFLYNVVSGDVVFYKPSDEKRIEYCAKDFNKYMFTDHSYVPHSYNISCGNCTKFYKTEMLQNMSLLLVSVTSEGNCRCPTDSDPLPYKPRMNTNIDHQRSMFYRNQSPCQPYLSEMVELFSEVEQNLPSVKLLVFIIIFLYFF